MATASGRENYTDLKRLYYYSFRFGLYHFVSGLEFYRCQENHWVLSRLHRSGVGRRSASST